MKFRRRLRVFPGFSLNFSTSGVSATLGPKGANVNFSKRGSYLNASIPGTGIYDRWKIGGSKSNVSENAYSASSDSYFSDPIIASESEVKGEIMSASTDQLTSASFQELHDTLKEAYQEKVEIPLEINQIKRELKKAKNKLLLSKIFIIGFFIKSLTEKVEECGSMVIPPSINACNISLVTVVRVTICIAFKIMIIKNDLTKSISTVKL